MGAQNVGTLSLASLLCCAAGQLKGSVVVSSCILCGQNHTESSFYVKGHSLGQTLDLKDFHCKIVKIHCKSKFHC